MSKLTIYEGTKYFPAVVALEVTLRCNMKCIHCGSSANHNPRSNELTLDEWKKVVDDLVELGSEYITLSGGEPFVWPHWAELSKYIARKGKTLSIVSNGYLITNDDIKFLKDIGMWNIGLSVDGLQNTHDKIRGIKGAYIRALGSVERFKKAGIKVVVSTSVSRLNIKDLSDLRKILSENGVDLWQLQIVNSFGRAGKNRHEMLISQDEYADLVEFIHKCQEEYKEHKNNMAVMPADSIGYCHGVAAKIWGDMEWCGCNAGRYVVGVRSDGDIVGCLSLQDPRFVGGNVRKKSLKEIWEDDLAFAYNRNFDSASLCGACEKCPEGEQCRGGCIAMGYSVTGHLYDNNYCYKHARHIRAAENREQAGLCL